MEDDFVRLYLEILMIKKWLIVKGESWNA